jgi:hypothetical protein
MQCPVCEAENRPGAHECANCGKILSKDEELLAEIVPVPGLEQTLQPAVDVDAERIPGLEQTQLAEKDLPVRAETVPGVEHTQLEADPEAPLNWTTGNTPLDSGREADDGVRTPAPQDDGTCPWCGSPSTDAVCGSCGRRRSRYTAGGPAGPVETSDETMMCPACFARVPHTSRCSECGTPFPLQEL